MIINRTDGLQIEGTLQHTITHSEMNTNLVVNIVRFMITLKASPDHVIWSNQNIENEC